MCLQHTRGSYLRLRLCRIPRLLVINLNQHKYGSSGLSSWEFHWDPRGNRTAELRFVTYVIPLAMTVWKTAMGGHCEIFLVAWSNFKKNVVKKSGMVIGPQVDYMGSGLCGGWWNKKSWFGWGLLDSGEILTLIEFYGACSFTAIAVKLQAPWDIGPWGLMGPKGSDLLSPSCPPPTNVTEEFRCGGECRRQSEGK